MKQQDRKRTSACEVVTSAARWVRKRLKIFGGVVVWVDLSDGGLGLVSCVREYGRA